MSDRGGEDGAVLRAPSDKAGEGEAKGLRDNGHPQTPTLLQTPLLPSAPCPAPVDLEGYRQAALSPARSLLTDVGSSSASRPPALSPLFRNARSCDAPNECRHAPGHTVVRARPRPAGDRTHSWRRLRRLISDLCRPRARCLVQSLLPVRFYQQAAVIEASSVSTPPLPDLSPSSQSTRLPNRALIAWLSTHRPRLSCPPSPRSPTCTPPARTPTLPTPPFDHRRAQHGQPERSPDMEGRLGRLVLHVRRIGGEFTVQRDDHLPH